MSPDDSLEQEIESILNPEQDEDAQFNWHFPHKNLLSVHGINASYYRGPFDSKGDKRFECLLNDNSDPIHDTLQSITVPYSLFTASIRLFADSIVKYQHHSRRRDQYRFYPPILITAWSAFEAWVKINSEIFTAVVPSLPLSVREDLLETHRYKPSLHRYWLLLKHGCGLNFDKGGKIWKNAETVVKIRDSLVHYKVSQSPSLTTLHLWEHLESILLLFIAASSEAKKTLFLHQFDLYHDLVALKPLIVDFEEQPIHKGWPREAKVFSCPFEGIDEAKYPRYQKFFSEMPEDLP